MYVTEFLVGFLVMGGAWAGPIISPDNIKDFATVIPMEKIWAIVSDYIAFDKDVKNLLGYVHTEEFKHMLTDIDAMPEFIEFLNSLESIGTPAYKYWNIMHILLGMAGLENPINPETPQLNGGVLGLVQDVKALLKEEDIVKVYDEAVKTNPKLMTLVEHFKGDQFKKVIENVISLPQVATLLEKMGITDIVENQRSARLTSCST